jgi:hypothetical protein
MFYRSAHFPDKFFYDDSPSTVEMRQMLQLKTKIDETGQHYTQSYMYGKHSELHLSQQQMRARKNKMQSMARKINLYSMLRKILSCSRA